MHVKWVGEWKEKLRKECFMLDPGLYTISSLLTCTSLACYSNKSWTFEESPLSLLVCAFYYYLSIMVLEKAARESGS